MLQIATVSLTALGAFAATLALVTAMFVGWRRDWLRLNLIGAFVGVLILLGVLAGGSNVDQSQGGIVRQVLTGLIYLASAWYALHDREGNWSSPVRFIPIMLFGLLSLTLVSILWSAAPMVTLRRAVQFAGLFVFAIALSRSFESDDLWRRYLNPLLLWVAVALVVLPIAPDIAFDNDGNFRGLSTHKNSWAGLALAAALITILQLQRSPRSIYFWCALGASLLTILLTRSATAVSLVAVALGIASVFTVLLSRNQSLKAGILMTAMAISLVPLAYLVVTGESPIQAATNLYLDIVQKDATLTGRNVLWETVLENAWVSPWLGNGYGAFWIGNSGPSVAVVANLNWTPVHSHNGFVDLFNELGFVGVGLFALVVIQHAFNIGRVWYSGSRDIALFHLMTLATILAYNLSETSILQATHFLWVLLIVSIVDTHRLAQSATKQ